MNDSLYSTVATYQWYRNNVLIAGATEALYIATDSGYYHIQVIDGSCSSVSGDVHVVRTSSSVTKPTIAKIPSAGSICGEMGSVLLYVTNATSYSASAHYIWYNRDSAAVVQQSTNSTYLATTGGEYYVQVVEGNCSSVSDQQQVPTSSSHIALPTIVSTSGDTNICGNGGSIVLHVTNIDSFAVSATYQWYKNNVSLGVSGQGVNYTATDSGYYSVQVTEGNCSSMSYPIHVTKNGSGTVIKPILSTQPTGGELCGVSGSVVIYVTNTINYTSGAHYNWFNDTGIVQSGSTPSYEATEAGNYYVQVVEGVCSSVSLPKQITTNSMGTINKPSISSTSGGTNICEVGGTVLLKITNGSLFTGMSYQWYKNGVLIAGATGNQYIATDSGIYRLQVIDGTCSSLSDSLQVTKSGGTSIASVVLSKQPNSNVICINGSVYYSVSNSIAYTNATYNWFKDTGIVKTGTDSYYEALSSGIYYVEVVEGGCSSVSQKDTLQGSPNVITQPEIGTTSGNLNICELGGSVVLSLSNGSAYSNAQYQWYKNGVAIVGATANYYIATDSGSYRLQVMEGSCSSLSISKQVTQDGLNSITKPLVTKNPSTDELCINGGTIQMSVSNSSSYSNTAIYAWHKDTGIIQQGSSTVLYAVSAGNYYVEVIDGLCSSVSAIDTLLNGVNSIASAQIGSNTPTICGDTGVSVLSLLNYTSYTNATYQWYKNDTLIVGAEDKVYIAKEAGTYRLRVTEGGCVSYSGTETIVKTSTVINSVITALFPADGEIPGVGNSVEISVVNTVDFTSPTYVWYKGSDSVSSGSSIYHATSAGIYYVVVKEGNGCSSISSGDTIRMSSSTIDQPLVSSVPSSDTLCGDAGSVVLTVTNASAYYAPIYRWFKDGVLIVGAQSSVYVANASGVYTVIVTDTGVNSAPSLGKTITKITGSSIIKPIVSSTSPNMNICGTTGSFILSVSNSSVYGTHTIYRWYKGSTIVQESEVPEYVVLDSGSYWVYVLDGSCSTVSDTTEVGYNTTGITKPQIASISGNTNICGSTGVVTLELTNATSYSNAIYTWYRNDTLLSGENNVTLHVHAAGAYRIQVSEGSCTSLSDSIPVTQDASSITAPIITKYPSGSALCNGQGSVYMYVTNKALYTNPVYRWYCNDTLIIGATEWYYDATKEGVYKVEIDEGSCTTESNVDTVKSSNTNIASPILSSSPSTNMICGNNGSVILTLSNSQSYGSQTNYQWYKHGVAINGATDSLYIATDSGTYRLQVMEGNCSVFSGTIHIDKNSSIIEMPIVVSSSPSLKLCAGGSILLRVDNTGDYSSTAQYIWYRGTAKVHEGTDTVYEVTTVGNYYVQVVDGGCSSVSVTDTIQSGGSVTQPTIASVSGGTVICGVNGSLMLELTNTSAYGTISIQWYKNNVAIVGATGTTYEALGAGSYKVQVLEGDCGSFSDTIGVTIDNGTQVTKPIVVSSSGSLTLCNGGSILLQVSNVSAYGSGARYVWYKNNVIVQDSVLSVYEVKNTGIYYVFVVDGACSARSINDTIIQGGTIITPTISSEPNSNTICGNGGIIMLTLTNASQYTNPSIQWYKNNVMIAGATDILYVARDSGDYRVEIVDGACTALSNTIHITKNNGSVEMPVLYSSSPNLELCIGGTILLSVDNTGDYSPNVRYIWYKDMAIVQDSTLAIYEVTSLGVYRVQVVDGSCSSISVSDTIRQGGVVISPVIASQPNSNIICGSNGVVILTLTNATIYTNPVIQWYKDNQIIAGATGIIYQAKDSGIYKVQIIDGNCGAFSNTIQVHKDTASVVVVPILMTSSPNLMLCTGGSILLSVANTVDYTSSARYIWYRGLDVVQNSLSSVYEVTTLGNYFVQVVDGGCSSVSGVDTITQGGNVTTPVISSDPNSNTICGVNGAVMLTLTNANQYTNPVIQWYKNNVIIPGATEIIYVVNDTGSYRVHVLDGSCGTFSTSIVVTKNNSLIEQPILISSSPNLEICTGGSMLFNVDNTGDYSLNARYVWYRGTNVVQDSVINTYETTIAGAYYVQVIDGNCASISVVDTLITSATIIATPTISSAPISNAICGDTGVVLLTFTNEAAYANPIVQWYKNNVRIAGATSVIYLAQDSGLYRVHVTDGSCTVFSDTIRLSKNNSVMAKPAMLSSSPTGVICGVNGSVLLTVDNASDYSAGTTRYIWYKGVRIVQDSLINTYETMDAGTYFVHIIDGTCSTASDTITLTKSLTNFAHPLIAAIPTSANVCGDTGVVLLSVTNISDYTSPSYQWYDGDVQIAGATASYYNAIDSGNYRVLVTEGGCTAFSAYIPVTKSSSVINQPIIVAYPPDGYIYGGNPAKLSLLNDILFVSPQYYWYNANMVLVDTTPVCTTNVAGRYRLLVVEGGCAAWSNEITLKDTVCNIPWMVVSNQSMCDSTSFDLANAVDTMSVNCIIKYYQDAMGQLPLASSIVNPHTTTTYYLQAVDTLTSCHTNIISVVITVIAKPALPNAIPDMIYANGAIVSSYLITGSSPSATYVWKKMSGDSIVGLPLNGINIIPSFTAINTTDTIIRATYMYTTDIVSGGLGCNAGDTAYFEVIILPTPDVHVQVQDQVICSGSVMDTIAFSGRVASTLYAWHRVSGNLPGLPTSGIGDIRDSIFYNAGMTPLSVTYQVVPTFTYRGVTSTGQTELFTITVNPMPVLNPVPDMEYCQGSLVPVYPFTGTVGATYSWRRIAGDSVGLPDNGVGNLPSFIALTDTAKVAHTAIYEVTILFTSANVTCSTIDTFFITINTNPTITRIIPDAVYCVNEQVPVFDFVTYFAAENNPVGTTYIWSRASGNTSSVGLSVTTGTDTMPSFVTINNTGGVVFEEYTVHAVIGTCTSAVHNFKITINPQLHINTLSDVIVCSHTRMAPILFTGNVSSATYTWARDLTTDSIPGLPNSGTGNSMPQVTPNNTGTTPLVARYMVTMNYTNEGVTCTDTSSFYITVNPYPTVDPVQNIELCNDDSLSIHFTGTANIFEWVKVTGDNIGNLPAKGNGDIFVAAVVNTLPRSLEATYKVVAKYSDVYGECEGEDSYFTIRVTPTLTLNSRAHVGEHCSDELFTYTATSLVPTITYSWVRLPDSAINGGATTSGSTATISEVLINSSDSIVRVFYEFTLQLDGCTALSTVSVDVMPGIEILAEDINKVCFATVGDVRIARLIHIGANSNYSLVFDVDAKLAGFRDISALVTQVDINVILPTNVSPGTYKGKLYITEGSCTKEKDFVIQVLKPTRIVVQPLSIYDNSCDDDRINLVVQAEGDSLTYQWYHNDTAISGANTNSYDFELAPELEGYYYVVVTGECGTVTSDTVKVLYNKLRIKRKWDDVLYVENPGAMYVSYRWYKDGHAITADATSQYYTASFAGKYRVRAYYADGTFDESCEQYFQSTKSRKMVLFPNPVRQWDNFKLTFEGETLDNATIEVRDVLGKLIETQVMSGDYIELRAWYAPGSYVVRIITQENGIRVKKLIVE
jgi:membrane carboxypeptidase/penicillin-binding protein PbpC